MQVFSMHILLSQEKQVHDYQQFERIMVFCIGIHSCRPNYRRSSETCRIMIRWASGGL